MKKLFSLLMILGVLSIGFNAYAQDDAQEGATTEQVENTIPENPDYSDELADMPEESLDQVIKQKFIEGDPKFMSPVLICLILGLAISIERIISLNMATTNTNKLLSKVEDALESGGVEAAKEVTKNTRGPVASIFTQGLMRMSEGIEMVEKSVIAYGSVEMGRLERGLVWISLFISLAPMLGFMGTVIGMIGAFDAIEAAGDISPGLVAGGIKVALLTTVGGLIVAIILQLFYNYCVSKIDSIVNSMEDASISLVDLLVKHNLSK
ncbi:MotA/TolQ/ExbB proton channel family protein [Roseivirga seohaensis]|uniref:Flagellar motor protein MotA n=2 Tax=Roseivirga seohaensis TaxID=1914963 RepID=A0A0L8AM69_9BACT|nr:MotA/TolQ/ExbB proton channel family protein [Roseivirga seohaensis]KOF03439.1 flagellar motor protein MotA [Roseivirga seohaensis subsp. aquiponti]KYG84953.1 flagellar motor protein MotA [Roseivirga seohaensis]